MQPIRFGPYALDARSGELRRDGELVPLAPQPFRLLLALASRPGELVTREELRREVWGDATFVDFERGLKSPPLPGPGRGPRPSAAPIATRPVRHGGELRAGR